MAPSSALARPSRWELAGLVLLALGMVAWGAVVELRGAFLQRRMTDAACFFRAGWVVRTGGPLYDFTEENGWHYIYPPLFAVLMVPLADAPAGMDRAGLLPYPVSVALWYVLSVALLAFSLHSLARALQEQSLDPELRAQAAGCRRWWALRLWPFLIFLPPIGHTLMRGQTNLLLLALLCSTASASLRGRPARAGMWLAGAICLKVYPAFLVLFFLWRRDLPALKACAAGLLLGLVVVPAAVFGPQRLADYYRQYAQILLGPALGLGSDQTLDSEILDSINNDSQSLGSALHNSLHLDRGTRPAKPSPVVTLTAFGIGGLLTLVTLLAAGWKRKAGPAPVLFFGALVAVMLLLCPVAHMHYFCLLVPLVMALLAIGWAGRGDLRLSAGLGLLLGLHAMVYVLCSLPGLDVLRDLGLLAYPTILLWLAAVVKLWQLRRDEALQPAQPRPGLAA